MLRPEYNPGHVQRAQLARHKTTQRLPGVKSSHRAVDAANRAVQPVCSRVLAPTGWTKGLGYRFASPAALKHIVYSFKPKLYCYYINSNVGIFILGSAYYL